MQRFCALVLFVFCGVVAAQSGTADSERVMGPVNWEPVHRENAVNVDEAFDTSNLAIDRFQIHELLAKDTIPSLTDPETVPLSEADFLMERGRIVLVEVNGAYLAVPIRVLNWHEMINIEVGGEPIAVTYCPLCDSVSVFSRRVPMPESVDSENAGADVTLEFGVTGALYNSNVLFYDKRTKSLWSQLGMEALSGPMVGTALRHLPFRVLRTPEVRIEAPEDTRVVTTNTGYTKPYESSPYEAYFTQPRLVVPVWFMDTRLPAKTLGLGVKVGDKSWFVPASDLMNLELSFDTPAGKVRATISTGGLVVLDAPEEAQLAQTFFYSWAAFHRGTEIVRVDEAEAAAVREKGGEERGVGSDGGDEG